MGIPWTERTIVSKCRAEHSRSSGFRCARSFLPLLLWERDLL